MLTQRRKLIDLEPGDDFRSLRASEGWLRVVCKQGECEHEKRDKYNMHVRSTEDRFEFFHQGAPDDEVDTMVPCVTCTEERDRNLFASGYDEAGRPACFLHQEKDA